MRTFAPVCILFVVAAPLSAQYTREFQSGNLGTYAWGASYGYDVDNDGVPNMWSRDSGRLVIYHNYVAWWTITFSGYAYVYLSTPRDVDGDGLVKPVNMDGDASGEVVVTAYRISGSDLFGRVRVYDAASRALEWESAELAGFTGTASVDDVDGDNKHEVIITRYNYTSGWGYVEAYGYTGVGLDGKPQYDVEKTEAFALPAVTAAGTEIRFGLDVSGEVKLAVLDALGRQVKSLLNTRLPPGDYRIRWDGTDSRGSEVAAGTYFYELSGPAGPQSGRLTKVH